MKKLLTATKTTKKGSEGQPAFVLHYNVSEPSKTMCRNYAYGFLVGDVEGGPRTKMRYRLFMAPNMEIAHNWDFDVEMTASQAIEAAQAHANRVSDLENLGKIYAVKFTSKFGVELYMADNDQFTLDFKEAKSMTKAEAEYHYNIMPSKEILKFECDEFEFSSIVDSIGASYSERPKHKHFGFEMLMKGALNSEVSSEISR